VLARDTVKENCAMKKIAATGSTCRASSNTAQVLSQMLCLAFRRNILILEKAAQAQLHLLSAIRPDARCSCSCSASLFLLRQHDWHAAALHAVLKAYLADGSCPAVLWKQQNAWSSAGPLQQHRLCCRLCAVGPATHMQQAALPSQVLPLSLVQKRPSPMLLPHHLGFASTL
jgi:hypothetical protein